MITKQYPNNYRIVTEEAFSYPPREAWTHKKLMIGNLLVTNLKLKKKKKKKQFS